MIATDPLSLVFIGCFVVSGTFLLISSLLGAGHEDLHFGHFGHMVHGSHAGHAPGHASGVAHHALPQGHSAGHTSASSGQAAQPSLPFWAVLASFFNLYALLTFLFWFGLIGYVLKNLADYGSFFAAATGLLVGIVGAILITLVMHRLGRDVGELTAESSELVGTLATVSMPIRAGGIGEVIYKKGTGGRKSLGARCVDGQAIPRDAEVVIVGYEKGIAQVQTWDRFIAETDDLEEALRAQQRGNDSTQTPDFTSPQSSEPV
ncbi:MAG TPA: hypothetical protein VFU69_03345 [Ktedonobacterales bacterium]|nr:hypothetical protein [Ktedonobacterales bacterium]